MSTPGGSFNRFTARADDPRRRGRRHATDLQCNLGKILDLSKVGMRVQVRGRTPLRVGQVTNTRIQIPEGTLNVKGRAVWIKRRGFRRFELGIEFIDVIKSVSAALESIAKFGFLGVSGGAAAPESENGGTASKSTLPDYYKILHVGRNASDQQIRDSFRRLARAYHPDVSKEPNAADKFHQVHEAYEILKNPNERRLYDRKLAG